MPDGSATADGRFLADTAGEAAVRSFRALAAAVDDGVYQLDAEGRFLAVNDVLAALTGYDADDLVGSQASSVFDSEGVQRLEAALAGDLEATDDGATGFDATVQPADGEPFPAELRVLDVVAEGDGRTLLGVLEARGDRDQPGGSAEAASGSSEPDSGSAESASESTGPTPGSAESAPGSPGSDAAEQLHEQQERRYEAIFEDPNILVGLLAPDGTVLDVNQTAMEYVDADLEAVRGERYWETPWWGDEAIRADVREWTERAADGEYVPFEADLDGPDGETHTVEGFFRPVTDEDGEVVSIIVSDRDVTERKRHERDLELFRALLDHTTDAVLVVDPETGRFVDANDTASEGLGYTREELLELSVSDVEERFSGPEDWQDHLEDIKAEGSQTITGAHRRKDGSTFPVEVNVSYVDLETPFVVAIARDVTERQVRQQELEQYETIVETIPDGAYVLDEDHRFTLVNETLVEMTGYDRDELLGSDAELISTEGGHERGLDLRKQLKSGEIDVAVLEEKIQTAAGDTFDAEIRFDALYDETGDFQGTAGVIRDISERKEYERKLEESNERLEQFAYAASHDLQEPLRMVTSYLQLIERRYVDDLDEEAEEFIEFAVDGAERMREMIDGLLQYSRVETRGDPFEPVDLNAVLEDVLADLQLQVEANEAAVESVDLPTVQGDASQLRQVFQNVLDNAIEYSGDGPPRIHVDAERSGDRWLVSVTDEGIGIDPGEADRVFEVFQRLHSNDEHEGTGIGLALCRRIVERHGGDIWVDSEPGEGSTFYFTLPAVDEAAT